MPDDTPTTSDPLVRVARDLTELEKLTADLWTLPRTRPVFGVGAGHGGTDRRGAVRDRWWQDGGAAAEAQEAGRMTRLERLATLHQLRAKVDAEIVAIERALSVEQERARRLAREETLRRKVSRKVALCGTPSGYYRHRRALAEPACEDCLRAHRQAERERAKRRKEAS